MSKGRERAAKARQIVADQKAAERRRTVTLWTSVAVVLMLFAAGLIGWTTLRGQDDGKVTVPSAAVDDGTAFAVGAGPVTVDVYEDFMCPACGSFEETTGGVLKQLATAGKITLRFHPVAILDKFSHGTAYSTRAAAASAAAGQEGKFTEFHDVLYANRPAENTAGLTDAKMIELAASVGLTSETFTTAVNGGTYKTWATQATEKFSKKGFNGTPTIAVNGEQLNGPDNSVPSTALVTETIDKAAG
ncbi:thioredoxin domain-containing protein [Actinoplanes sp. NEAU-A12]|uniref:Thioredoxin domain-containing protein n=1 Tax=Actinoplanes sandaracinus TaxID=3045177 RepID=A0ABT6WQ78_9ACTN|nr:thioredoxin domain-containing protein [Actinoplanes sandaracinus]MDI6101869.1 thioredoxin domain-containing protein [Actinoplanes sandaracinus]